MYVYLNNRVVPREEAVISVFDHGFLYGDGVYETMRVYGGVVFMIDEHIRRLYRSADMIGLTIKDNAGSLKSKIYETLNANNLKDAYLRLTISRGYGGLGLDPKLCKMPTLVIIAEHFKKYPKAFYENGVRVLIPQIRRNLKSALNPQIKSLNFLNNILAKLEAIKGSAYEAVMLNADGFLTEGTVSNIFFLKNNLLCTPSLRCGILNGITRAIVIKLAVKEAIHVKEGEFRREELYGADEVFLTNTTMEIMPVSAVDDRSHEVGSLTKLLHRAYKQKVMEYVANVKAQSHSK